jgi:hypothetical protein
MLAHSYDGARRITGKLACAPLLFLGRLEHRHRKIAVVVARDDLEVVECRPELAPPPCRSGADDPAQNHLGFTYRRPFGQLRGV